MPGGGGKGRRRSAVVGAGDGQCGWGAQDNQSWTALSCWLLFVVFAPRSRGDEPRDLLWCIHALSRPSLATPALFSKLE